MSDTMKIMDKSNRSAMVTIGVSTLVDFAKYKVMKQIPARIDTGARTSSLWVSKISVEDDMVSFAFFGPSSPLYTGKRITLPIHSTRFVTNSTGLEQERYVVEISTRIQGRRFKAKYTLSDRSTQSYPILVGRNTLRGNFLIDCSNPGEAATYKDPDEINEFNESEAL